MIKRIIPLLFVCTNLLAAPYQSKGFFQNNGGVIDHISPLLIPDTHAGAVENITMDDRGQLSKRNGYTVIQATGALGPITKVVTGGTYHTAASGSSFFEVVVGTDIYKIGNTFSSYSKVTGSVSLTASASNLAQATHLQDFAVFCNESDKPFYLGSTGNAITISTNTFDAAKTCATYGSYLVIANTTESSTAYPTRVRWSDINNINSFPALNYIDVEPSDGDRIISIISFDEYVYIFKHNSIYKMMITGLDGPDAFIIRPVSRNVGAWAKNSVKVIPNVGIMFLAQHTAYLLNDKGLTPIGDPIQRTFDTIQHSQWQNSVAEVYPQRYQYWLSVSTAGSTNTEVLVYDYVQNNWTIYDDMKVNMLALAEDSTGKQVLISGDYTATTYKQDTGSTDNPSGVSTAITASYTTANLLFDSPDITKQFKYLYIYTLGDVNYILTTKAAYEFNSSYETTTNVSIGSPGAVYDTGIYDTDVYPASGYAVTRLELNRSARSLRLQFSNSTSGQIFGLIGWTVVYSMEDFRQ